jgi:serine/threonine protein kinase
MERYKFLHIIGKGAFSEVYLGFDTETGNNVAIKKNLRKNEKLALEEIKILEIIKRETLSGSLAFFQSFEDKEYIYVVTEYLGSYSELKINNPLTIDEKAELMVEMIRGLNDLHRIDIVHMDIKPDNILVDPMKLKCKYIDFGFSCFDSDCNETIKVRGTPRYLHPGYLRVQKVSSLEFGKKIDRWALAITMFNLLIEEYVDRYYAKAMGKEIPGTTTKSLLQFILNNYDRNFVEWVLTTPEVLELKKRYPLIAETLAKYLEL